MVLVPKDDSHNKREKEPWTWEHRFHSLVDERVDKSTMRKHGDSDNFIGTHANEGDEAAASAGDIYG